MTSNASQTFENCGCEKLPMLGGEGILSSGTSIKRKVENTGPYQKFRLDMEFVVRTRAIGKTLNVIVGGVESIINYDIDEYKNIAGCGEERTERIMTAEFWIDKNSISESIDIVLTETGFESKQYAFLGILKLQLDGFTQCMRNSTLSEINNKCICDEGFYSEEIPSRSSWSLYDCSLAQVCKPCPTVFSSCENSSKALSCENNFKLYDNDCLDDKGKAIILLSYFNISLS